MDKLDLGLGFTIIMFIIFAIIYYLIAIVNYVIVVFLGGRFKLIMEKNESWKNQKQNMISLSIPFILSAIIIYCIIIRLPFFHATKTQITRNVITESVFIEPYNYYFTGLISYVVGLTCLSLTRYSYRKNMTIIGKLKIKRMVSNFALWTTMALFLTFICKFLSNYYIPFWLTYPLFTVIMTLFLIKIFNINKSTTDKYRK